jgi:Smg protein
MKTDVLELLVYLFEHYMDDEGERLPDEEGLRDELQQAGFRLHDIRKAFAWLGDLADRPEPLGATANDSALRHYDDSEMARLDASCRGFLLFLEHNGVLNSLSRERVIDRLMALEGDLISIEHVKWVVLLVLFSEPGEEAAFAWMHELVYESDPAGDYLH